MLVGGGLFGVNSSPQKRRALSPDSAAGALHTLRHVCLTGSIRIVTAYLLFLFALTSTAWSQRSQDAGTFAFTIFDAPGAGTGAYEGTAAFTMNTLGDVTGTYEDNGNVGHGFVRLANGTLSEFKAPGAGTSSTQGTFPISINASML